MQDALLLARIQFAFTISFHIVFPAITVPVVSVPDTRMPYSRLKSMTLQFPALGSPISVSGALS